MDAEYIIKKLIEIYSEQNGCSVESIELERDLNEERKAIMEG